LGRALVHVDMMPVYRVSRIQCSDSGNTHHLHGANHNNTVKSYVGLLLICTVYDYCESF